jgi:hypothetical protein
MIKLLFYSSFFIAVMGCGDKTSDKASEICDCVDSKQNSESDAMATMKVMDECTKDRQEKVKGMSDEEKDAFTKKVNECLKNACEGKGMNYEIGVQ